MVNDDLKNIKGLSPEERIERLKKLTEKNKKEIEEAQRMLVSSEEEIEDKKKELSHVPIPQIKSISIDTLFGKEEKQIYDTSRFTKTEAEGAEEEKRLEDNIEDELPKLTEKQIEQAEKLSMQPAKKLYNMVKNLYKDVKENGELSEDDMEKAGSIMYAIKMKEEDISQGNYKRTSEEVNEIMGITKTMMKYIR